MERNMSHEKVVKIPPANPQLLIENAKPIKIYLEGFSITESVDLIKKVKDYGGEISRLVGDGVLILSHPESSFKTEFPKFHIKWLHDCIKFNKLLNPAEYLFEFPNTIIKQEVEEEDHHSIDPINIKLLQETNAANFRSLREAIIRISKVLSIPQPLASPNIIDENLIPEGTSEMQRSLECGRCSQQPIYTSCDSPEANKSSKRKNHCYTTSSLLNNSMVSVPKLELSTSNIEHNEVDYHNEEEDMIGIADFSFAQAQASTHNNENTVPEDTSEIRKLSKRRRRSRQQVHTTSDSPEENISSKNKYFRYTEEEDRAMIQYLIDNDAIKIAAGLTIWKKMHEDGMMQHRTANSMAVYFCTSLRHRIGDFTSDEEVLRKFELREIESKLRAEKRLKSDYV